MRQFNTDCEGPITKNDNAEELAEYFIPEGNEFFAKLSRYDDYLADVEKKPGYHAGDTLKLILPFLKAYGATDEKIRDYSLQHINIVPGADQLLQFVLGKVPAFIISTSYEHYVHAFCEVTGFPFHNAYCTRLTLDNYLLNHQEKRKITQIKEHIDSLPMVELDFTTECTFHESKNNHAIADEMNDIFWKELASLPAGKLLTDIHPIGGSEKTYSIEHSLKVTNNNMSDVMYVGDSITDELALDRVKDAGGLAIAFNGNNFAISKADIACISGHASVTAILADIFIKWGKQRVLQVANSWSIERLEEVEVENHLLDALKSLGDDTQVRVEVVTEDNKLSLIEESNSFRKSFRGEAIGGLG